MYTSIETAPLSSICCLCLSYPGARGPSGVTAGPAPNSMLEEAPIPPIAFTNGDEFVRVAFGNAGMPKEPAGGCLEDAFGFRTLRHCQYQFKSFGQRKVRTGR